MRFEFEHCWHFPATPEQRAVLQAIRQNRKIEVSQQTVIAELVAERFIEPEDNGFRLTANGRYLFEKHSELDRKFEFIKLQMAIDDYKRAAELLSGDGTEWSKYRTPDEWRRLRGGRTV